MITRILGIDPGFGRVGYGIIERHGSFVRHVDHGCIVTNPKASFGKRLDHIARAVEELCRVHAPRIMGVEELFFAKNVTTGIQVGHARGVIILAGVRAGVPVAEVTPLEVKKTVTGYGKADKKQVQYMVYQALGFREKRPQDDAIDALAVALTVAAHMPRQGRLTKKRP
jgi:crossover junction endodeoxyribonuclease RuvC